MIETSQLSFAFLTNSWINCYGIKEKNELTTEWIMKLEMNGTELARKEWANNEVEWAIN